MSRIDEDIDRAFGRPIPGIYLSCDACAPGGGPCLREVKRAPRILIPTLPDGPPALPMRIMTTLHYCDLHAGSFDLQTYLSAAVKQRIERGARALRGPDFRADFERASVEIVLTTTPEYREFTVYTGMQRVARA